MPGGKEPNIRPKPILAGQGEGEGDDDTSLALPGKQSQLIRDAVSSGTPVVIVLLTCNALDLGFAHKSDGVKAILHAFYPQMWGGE